MSKISYAVGTCFGEFLQDRFPTFVRVEDGENTCPDFYDKENKFWIEAKTGFWDKTS